MSLFQSRQLANGLQIVGEVSPSARSVAIGFFVRTGARDETPEVSGVSHFLEHMVFKGTPRRTALDVNRDFDRIGANYNAFTSEENTVFYAAVLPEYLPQAVDLLADILRPSLRVEDFDMEKQVILEEIEMYEDQPASLVYDHAKRVHFGTHPLGASILGSPESIRALKSDQMESYFRRRYVAPNITIAAAGNFDWSQLVELVEKACGAWETGAAARSELREAPGTGTFNVETREKLTQQHVVQVSVGPPATSPLREASDLLSMIVGDDTSSRLYWELVDPGMAESADMTFHEYDGTGSYYTSFSCEPEQTEENLRIVRDVLARVQEEGVTEEELRLAQVKAGSRLVRGGERSMGRMQALGMHWVYLGQYRSVDDDLNAYSAVTLPMIREVLDRYPLTRPTTLALGPLAKIQAP